MVLGHVKDDVAEAEGRIALATSSAQLRDLLDRKVFAVILGCEGAMPVADDLTRLEVLYELGLRCLGLTWNSTNALAIGLGQPSDGGLSLLGRRAVGWMNNLGVIVDLSHASPRTFDDVVRVTRAPVVVSHANARELHDHERNLNGNQLAAVRDLEGLVGVTAFPAFVGVPPLGVADVADHLEFLVDALGIDCVGIGSDFIDFNRGRSCGR